MKWMKKEQYFWVVYGILLILLFLMSSTNLIIKENKHEIRAISVIVDDSKDNYYVNFRKGMDQATIDYNIDVNFITLYERNNAINQMDLLEREAEDGVDAVVAVPVDNLKFSERLEKAAVHIPVVVMDNEWTSSLVSGNITMDYYEAGRTLALRALLDTKSDHPVFLFTEGLKYSSNARLYDGVVSVLKERNQPFVLKEGGQPEEITDLLHQALGENRGDFAVIALDQETLSKTALCVEKLDPMGERVRLYGCGFNMEVLSCLENDVIKGVVMNNQYDEGYLAMEMALEAVENPGAVKNRVILKHHYIEKKDVRSKEYEKMLFPIQ